MDGRALTLYQRYAENGISIALFNNKMGVEEKKTRLSARCTFSITFRLKLNCLHLLLQDPNLLSLSGLPFFLYVPFEKSLLKRGITGTPRAPCIRNSVFTNPNEIFFLDQAVLNFQHFGPADGEWLGSYENWVVVTLETW